MTTPVVERLGAADAEDARTIRLEALKLHPESFCADLEAWEAKTLEQWQSMLSAGAWFGVRQSGKLVAVAAFTRPCSEKLAHTGELSGMYVRAEQRGTGIADALIHGVIEHAVHEVVQVKLTVNAENTRAIKLYERHGFRIVGRIPHVIHVGDKFYDEVVMVRGVSTTD
jgi:ribosomal protein S18 acetylase RimI-like enzyme